MKIAIPDDYQDCIRHLACFARLAAHEVLIYNDSSDDESELARRFADCDALVLIRERTRHCLTACHA